MHHSVNQLFLTTFRIFLHKGQNLNSGIFRTFGLQRINHLVYVLDRLKFVVLNRDCGFGYT